jgi:hypothetical protein
MKRRTQAILIATSVAALAALALLGVGVAAAGPASAGGNSDEAGLQAVRQITKQYQSPAAAIADGFLPTDECVPGMGYHYVYPDRLDDQLQTSRPEALLYVPDGNGGLRLAGAEWLVVDEDQDLSTDDDRPQAYGHDFDGPMPGHGPGMPIHYDLHAYAWVANPAGGFATWNSAITCP